MQNKYNLATKMKEKRGRFYRDVSHLIKSTETQSKDKIIIPTDNPFFSNRVQGVH